MKKVKAFALAIGLTAATFANAQRTDTKEQERVQKEYNDRGARTETRGNHTVTTSRDGSVTETWVDGNGEENTYTKDASGKVTTTIDHKDGTKSVNGVRSGGSSASRGPSSAGSRGGNDNAGSGSSGNSSSGGGGGKSYGGGFDGGGSKGKPGGKDF